MKKWCKNGGYKGKAIPCFNNGNKLKVYFIEKQNLNVLVDLKKKYANTTIKEMIVSTFPDIHKKNVIHY